MKTEKKTGKTPDVKKDVKTPKGKAATPMAPRDRPGFMKKIFDGGMCKGGGVKKGFQAGGPVGAAPIIEPKASQPSDPKTQMQQRRAAADKAAQLANVPPPATAAPVPAGPKAATPMQPKPVPAPAAPSPVPKALQVRNQEKSGRGIMGKLFPKMKRQGFEEGGPVLDEAAEPGEVMATAPESSGEIVEGAEPVANASGEAVPPVVEGELPAEVPGDGGDQVITEGPFSEYLKEGVDPQLVEKGNELTKRLAESSSDEATMTQFMADTKDYIDELGNAVKTAQGQGGGEMLRGLKAMLKDAQDLMTAHENIMAETGSADQAIQNAPDIVMMASRKSEAA